MPTDRRPTSRSLTAAQAQTLFGNLLSTERVIEDGLGQKSIYAAEDQLYTVVSKFYDLPIPGIERMLDRYSLTGMALWKKARSFAQKSATEKELAKAVAAFNAVRFEIFMAILRALGRYPK